MFTVQKSRNWFPNPVLLTLESGKLLLLNKANIGELGNGLAGAIMQGAFSAVIITHNLCVGDT